MNRRTTPPVAGTVAPDDHGFSLIEVVVAMAILLVASTAIFSAFATSSKQVNSVQGMVELQSRTRTVLSGIESELRNSFTGDAATNRVASIAPAAITFYTADRSTPIRIRKITYQLTGGVLTRASTTSTNTGPPYVWTFPAAASNALPVLTGVQNTTLFVFRDKNGATLSYGASTSLVDTVEITLQVRDTRAAITQKAETYTTTVRLRGTG